MSMFKPQKDDKLGIFQHGVSVGKQEEHERIIGLLLKLRTCDPMKGLCENCQQIEFCIEQIREGRE